MDATHKPHDVCVSKLEVQECARTHILEPHPCQFLNRFLQPTPKTSVQYFMSAKKTTCDSMSNDITKEEKQRYSIGEEIANSVTHGVGAGLAIEALVLLTVRAASRPDVSVTSYVIFGVSLIVLYLASTLYHALPAGAKNVFGIFDHASIFILIAGTYTPYCLSILKGALGWTIFGIIWGLDVLGIVLYAVFGRKARAVTTAMYIIMGWLIIFATGKIKSMMPPLSFTLLLCGGIAYTIGCIFYAIKKIKWMHSIWHLFVLGGSVLHFFSIYLY